MENRKPLNKILLNQVYYHFHIITRIHDIADSSFKYMRLDNNGRPQMYQVEYARNGKELFVDWSSEEIVGSPVFTDSLVE